MVRLPVRGLFFADVGKVLFFPDTFVAGLFPSSCIHAFWSIHEIFVFPATCIFNTECEIMRTPVQLPLSRRKSPSSFSIEDPPSPPLLEF